MVDHKPAQRRGIEDRHYREEEASSYTEEDVKRVLASQKSYVTPALIVFLLYCFFYIPGLIFNIIYLNEAEKTARISGEKPGGMGCLQIMLYLQIATLILFLLFAILFCAVV